MPMLEQERLLYDIRLKLALTYGRANRLNQISGAAVGVGLGVGLGVTIDVAHLQIPDLRPVNGTWSVLVSGIGGAVTVTVTVTVGQTLAVAAQAAG